MPRVSHGKGEAMSDVRKIELNVNGVRYVREIETRLTMADFLRHELGLTGTHLGCEHGVCGACTVHLDGEAVRSCTLFAVQANGCEITTVEGLADPGGTLHPVQQALRDHHGVQCGFCTSGMAMSITAFLAENPNPTERDVREGLSGNICRCTGYQGIVAAVLAAAQQLRQSDTKKD